MEKDIATEEWLKAQKASTRGTYKWSWKHFLSFAGLTGDAILADRRNDQVFAWEKRVLAAKTWAQERGLSDNTAYSITTSARSFFTHHRLPLKLLRAEKVRLTEVEPKYEDYQFSIEDFERMGNFADLTEKYVYIAGKSFGLRASDFLRLTRGDLEPYIDREPPISIGEITTKKEKVPANPFIDCDAQVIIKLMLETMTQAGRTDPNDKMLTYKDEIQLSQVVQRIVEKAKINLGNKRVRFHCLRKFLCDHLAAHMAESKWKQIVGKKAKERVYITELRECYARAMRETTFSKSIGSGDMQKIAKREVLLGVLKGIGISESEVADLFKGRFASRGRMLTIEDEIEVIEEAIEEKRKEKLECADGEHCQRVVGEEDLAKLLSEGWHASLVLPSGKVVVTR